MGPSCKSPLHSFPSKRAKIKGKNSWCHQQAMLKIHSDTLLNCFKEKAGICLSWRKRGKKIPDNPPKGQRRAGRQTSGDLCDYLMPISGKEQDFTFNKLNSPPHTKIHNLTNPSEPWISLLLIKPEKSSQRSIKRFFYLPSLRNCAWATTKYHVKMIFLFGS